MKEHVNLVHLVGEIGKEPEVKQSASGKAYCRYVLDMRSGERVTRLPLVAFGYDCEEIKLAYANGQPVDVKGRLYNKKDKNGNWGLNIYTESITIVGRPTSGPKDDNGDEIPF